MKNKENIKIVLDKDNNLKNKKRYEACGIALSPHYIDGYMDGYDRASRGLPCEYKKRSVGGL